MVPFGQMPSPMLQTPSPQGPFGLRMWGGGWAAIHNPNVKTCLRKPCHRIWLLPNAFFWPKLRLHSMARAFATFCLWIFHCHELLTYVTPLSKARAAITEARDKKGNSLGFCQHTTLGRDPKPHSHKIVCPKNMRMGWDSGFVV